jgi:hypothetical protein
VRNPRIGGHQLDRALSDLEERSDTHVPGQSRAECFTAKRPWDGRSRPSSGRGRSIASNVVSAQRETSRPRKLSDENGEADAWRALPQRGAGLEDIVGAGRLHALGGGCSRRRKAAEDAVAEVRPSGSRWRSIASLSGSTEALSDVVPEALHPPYECFPPQASSSHERAT